MNRKITRQDVVEAAAAKGMVFPAPAGMNRRLARLNRAAHRVPRASGDEPI